VSVLHEASVALVLVKDGFMTMDNRWNETLQTTPYFAFVEGFEEIGKAKGTEWIPKWWFKLLSNRHGLSVPTHCAWLDCVRTHDFLKLEWRFEDCAIGDSAQGSSRRDKIKSLPDSMFKIVFVPLSKKLAAEAKVINAFQASTWHRIILGPRPGLSVVAGPDFDLQDGAIEYLNLEHYGACLLEEREQLTNVFNLNFISDAKFGDDEEAGTTSTVKPSGGSGPARPKSRKKVRVGKNIPKRSKK
jgi:hypothetical protein